MRVFSDVATRELYAVTPSLASERFGRGEQLRANTVSAPIASYVHALELTTPPTSVLKVGKDHHLADAHDLAVSLGHQHVAATTARLFHRIPVGVNIAPVLEFGRQ